MKTSIPRHELQDADKVLKELRTVYGLASIKEFCKFVGISQNTHTAWVKTNSYNLELLTSKFPDVRRGYLATGEGSIFEEKTAEHVFTKYVAKLEKLVSKLEQQNQLLSEKVDRLSRIMDILD